MIDLDELTFIIISSLMISDIILILYSKKLIHTIIFLFFFLLMVASIFIVINSVFLALAELFIYNGGIVVLLTLGASIAPDTFEDSKVKLYILLVPAIILLLLSIMAIKFNFSTISQYSYQNLGMSILSSYVFLFFIVAIVSIATALSVVYLLSKEDRT